MRFFKDNWFRLVIVIFIVIALRMVHKFLIIKEYSLRAECLAVAEDMESRGINTLRTFNSCLDVSDKVQEHLFK